ncbi:ADP-ribosyltransferase [Saccharopolyspora elongata]|nr:ADP-ribosyltransferase [Saccharopolyspora elongata]
MPRQRHPETPSRLNDPANPRPQGTHPDAPRPDAPRVEAPRPDAPHADGTRPDAPHAPQPIRPQAARHADADRYPYADVKHEDFAHVKGEGVRHWGPGWQQRMAEDARIRAESLGYHKPDTPHAPEPAAPDAPPRSTSESMAAERPPKNPFEHRWNNRVGEGEPLDISDELREKLGGRGLAIRNTDSGLSMIRDLPRSHFNRAQDFAQRMPRPAVDPKRFTVEVHGSPNGVSFNGKELSAKELAEIIKGAPGYKHGEPVRLLSCQTGADLPDGSPNFAQQLSKELGVEVLAPNKDAWVDNFGNMYASGSRAEFDVDASGTPQPRFDEPGQWVSFSPDGTKAVHDSPFPPGHEPEWTRFGHQADAAHQRGYGDQPPKEFQHPGGPAWGGWHSRPDAYNEPVPGHLMPNGEFVPHGEFDVHGKWIPHGQLDNLNRWVPGHLNANGQLVPNGHYDQSGAWVAHGRTDEFGRWIPVHRDADGYHDLGRFNPQNHQWEPAGYVDRNTGQFVPNNPPQQVPHGGPPQAGPGHQSAPNAGQAQQTPPAAPHSQPAQAPQPMTAQSGYGSHQQAGQHPAAPQQSPPQQPMQQQAPQQPNYQQPAAPHAGQQPIHQQPAAPRAWQQPAPPHAGQQPPAAPHAGQQPQPMQQQPAQPPRQPQQPPAAAPQFGQQPPLARQQQPPAATPQQQQGTRQQPPAANAQQTPQQPNRPAGAQPAAGQQRQAPQFPASRQPSAPQQPAAPSARPSAPPPADVSGPRPAPAAPRQAAPPVDVRGPRMDGLSSQTRAPGGQPQTPGSPRPAQPPADVSGPRQPQSPEAPRRPDSAQGPGTSPQAPTGHRSDAPPAETNGPGSKPADAPPHAPEPGKPTDTTTPRTNQQAESWQNDFEPERSNAPEAPAADSSTWRNDFEPSEPASPPKNRENLETEAPAATDSTTNAPKQDADDWSPFDPKPDPAPSGHSEVDAPKQHADDWSPFDPKPDPQSPGHSEVDAPKQEADGWRPFDPKPDPQGDAPDLKSADSGGYGDAPKSDFDRPDESVDFDRDSIDPDEFMERISDRNFRADEVTEKAVRGEYGRDPEGVKLAKDRDDLLAKNLKEIESIDPDLAQRIRSMSDVEKLQLYAYTQPGHFYEMNDALRRQDPEAIAKYRDKIEVMVSALNQIPDFSGPAHRVINTGNPDFAAAIAAGYNPGELVTENSFTSTSVRPDPDNPSQPKSKFPGNVELHMNLKTGKDIRFINPNTGEAEVLLPPGCVFKVVDKWFDEAKGKWHIKLDQVLVEDIPDGKLPPPPKLDYTPSQEARKPNISNMLDGFG